jgi:hypothetical protein
LITDIGSKKEFDKNYSFKKWMDKTDKYL